MCLRLCVMRPSLSTCVVFVPVHKCARVLVSMHVCVVVWYVHVSYISVHMFTHTRAMHICACVCGVHAYSICVLVSVHVCVHVCDSVVCICAQMCIHNLCCAYVWCVQAYMCMLL